MPLSFMDTLNLCPLIGILRGICADSLNPVLSTAFDAGLRIIEITMNTDQAGPLIQQAVTHRGDRMIIGAGTVLSLDDLDRALTAGARFIVSPVNNAEIMERCRDLKIPVFPGAFTPQEIVSAWEAGATMVKVFPASCLGPRFFKEMSGPLPHIPLLACGGVTPESVPVYLQAGAKALAVGSGTFRESWIQDKEYDAIGNQLKLLITAIQQSS